MNALLARVGVVALALNISTGLLGREKDDEVSVINLKLPLDPNRSGLAGIRPNSVLRIDVNDDATTWGDFLSALKYANEQNLEVLMGAGLRWLSFRERPGIHNIGHLKSIGDHSEKAELDGKNTASPEGQPLTLWCEATKENSVVLLGTNKPLSDFLRGKNFPSSIILLKIDSAKPLSKAFGILCDTTKWSCVIDVTFVWEKFPQGGGK